VYSDVLFFVSPNIPRICVIHQDPRLVTVKLLLRLKICAHSGYYPSSDTSDEQPLTQSAHNEVCMTAHSSSLIVSMCFTSLLSVELKMQEQYITKFWPNYRGYSAGLLWNLVPGC